MIRKIYNRSNILFLDKFRKQFHPSEIIRKDAFLDFYKNLEPSISTNAVNLRIHNLVKSGILQRKGYGLYALGIESRFIPTLGDEMEALYLKLNTKFPFLSFCIWDTFFINEFMLHQPAKHYILIETEPEAQEAVFYFLKQLYNPVFLNPDNKTLSLYASDYQLSYLVTHLVTEAPLQEINTIPTVTIEKMLVDIFCDQDIFIAQQGEEMSVIFREAFSKYTINSSKLLRYSGRRRKKEVLMQYLEKTINFRH
jgi:hypothetical protein